jgi:hypothetical protein
MKYFARALIHDLEFLLLMLVLILLVAGLIALIVFVAGDYSTAVLLGLLCVGVQVRITWERAQALKGRDKK